MKKIILLVMISILLFVGCGSQPLTLEKYNKIEIGMSYEDVREMLGKGVVEDSCKNIKSYIWQDGEKAISILFEDGKVHTKAQSGL